MRPGLAGVRDWMQGIRNIPPPLFCCRQPEYPRPHLSIFSPPRPWRRYLEEERSQLVTLVAEHILVYILV